MPKKAKLTRVAWSKDEVKTLKTLAKQKGSRQDCKIPQENARRRDGEGLRARGIALNAIASDPSL